MTGPVPDEVVEVYRAGKQAGGMGTGTAGPGPGLAAVFDRYGWPDRLSGPVPGSAPPSPSPGAAGPPTAHTAGARGIVGFLRARLEDLAADAGAYHSDGARMPFPPPRCASLDYRGPCDCGVLRHLAAEWSDHPDYLTEWAP